MHDGERGQPIERVELGPEQEWPLGAIVPLPTGPNGVTVASVVPAGFDRYLRVLHPFRGDDPAVQRTWASLTAEFGLVYHPAISPRSFDPFLTTRVDPDSVRPDTTSDDGRLVREGHNVSFLMLGPDWGDLVDLARSRLFELLVGAAAGTPTFFYWGLAAIVRGFEPILYRGPMETFARIDKALPREMDEPIEGPELIWSADRAFLVATDSDLTSTYVGCGEALAAAILGDEELETLPVALDTRVDDDADFVNARGLAP